MAFKKDVDDLFQVFDMIILEVETLIMMAMVLSNDVVISVGWPM